MGDRKVVGCPALTFEVRQLLLACRMKAIHLSAGKPFDETS